MPWNRKCAAQALPELVKEETGMDKDEVNGNNNVGVYLNNSQESYK